MLSLPWKVKKDGNSGQDTPYRQITLRGAGALGAKVVLTPHFSVTAPFEANSRSVGQQLYGAA